MTNNKQINVLVPVEVYDSLRTTSFNLKRSIPSLIRDRILPISRQEFMDNSINPITGKRTMDSVVNYLISKGIICPEPDQQP